MQINDGTNENTWLLLAGQKHHPHTVSVVSDDFFIPITIISLRPSSPKRLKVFQSDPPHYSFFFSNLGLPKLNMHIYYPGILSKMQVLIW